MWGLSRKLREIVIGICAFIAVLAIGVVAQLGAEAELIGAIICGSLAVLVVLATAPAKRKPARTNTWFEAQPPRRPVPTRPFSTIVTRLPAKPSEQSPATTVTPAPAPARAPPAVTDTPARVIAIKKPWVVDGDTIDDSETRIRFRIENIDAPEIKNAKCAAEAHMGERSKWKAYELIKAATNVEAHATGRIDPYGRMIARIKLDGEDLGDKLVAGGFARPWTGARENWCGHDGPLNTIARTCYGRPICHDCARAPVSGS